MLSPRRPLHRLLPAVTFAAALLGLTAALLTAATARAASITVTTANDELNADGDCSLREALSAANLDQPVDACPAGSGADTIQLPAGNFDFTLGGTGENAGATGDLDILQPVTLIGAGRTSTFIDANQLDRHFELHGSVAVTLTDLTLRRGSAGSANAGSILVGSSHLTLLRVRITDNASGGFSGAVVVGGGRLTVRDSLLDDNNGTNGGALVVNPTGHALIVNSALFSNSVSFDGGAINSTGVLTVVNSTLSGNTAQADGGGLYSEGTASLYNVTVANNTAALFGDPNGDGGGVFVAAGTLTARNSLLADNADLSNAALHPDCSGTLTGAGYNLVEVTNGCTLAGDNTGNLTGIPPGLAALGNNGGSTFTHALLAGSAAIQGGNPAGCVDHTGQVLTTDQRGYQRPVNTFGGPGSECDLGAYEYASPGTPAPTNTPTATKTATVTRTPSASPTATRTATATSTRTPTVSHTYAPPAGTPLFVPLIVH